MAPSSPISPRPKPLNMLLPAGTPTSIGDLKEEDIYLFTTLLSQWPGHPLFAGRSEEFIATFPAHLLNPTPLLLRGLSQASLGKFLQRSGVSGKLPRIAKLCPVHKDLNALLVGNIIEMVEGEVEKHLANHIPSRQHFERLSPEVQGVIHGLENIMAMSLDPTQFQHLDQRGYHYQLACVPYIHSAQRCDACALCGIGTDADVLVGLRASMMAREDEDARHAQKKLAALNWVAECMRAYDKEFSLTMLLISGRVADELKGLKREVQPVAAYSQPRAQDSSTNTTEDKRHSAESCVSGTQTEDVVNRPIHESRPPSTSEHEPAIQPEADAPVVRRRENTKAKPPPINTLRNQPSDAELSIINAYARDTICSNTARIHSWINRIEDPLGPSRTHLDLPVSPLYRDVSWPSTRVESAQLNSAAQYDVRASQRVTSVKQNEMGNRRDSTVPMPDTNYETKPRGPVPSRKPFSAMKYG